MNVCLYKRGTNITGDINLLLSPYERWSQQWSYNLSSMNHSFPPLLDSVEPVTCSVLHTTAVAIIRRRGALTGMWLFVYFCHQWFMKNRKSWFAVNYWLSLMSGRKRMMTSEDPYWLFRRLGFHDCNTRNLQRCRNNEAFKKHILAKIIQEMDVLQ